MYLRERGKTRRSASWTETAASGTFSAMQDMPKSRIASILMQHCVLFGGGVIGLDPWVRAEAAELTASLDRLSEAQARRIASILRQHAILFGHGTVLDTEETVTEDRRLLEALRPAPPQEAPERPLPPPPRPEDPAARTEPPRGRRTAPDPGPVPSDPALDSPSDPHREFRLFGEGRRTRIPERAGMAVLWCRDHDSLSSAVLLIPLAGLVRHILEPEPVELWFTGPVHCILMEPFDAVRRGLGHREWPSSLDGPPDQASMLTIHTDAGDRICLGMRPLRIGGTRHVAAAVDKGIYPYFFPEDGGLTQRLSGFLAYALRVRIGVSRNDADGVAYFAVRRILRPN